MPNKTSTQANQKPQAKINRSSWDGLDLGKLTRPLSPVLAAAAAWVSPAKKTA